MLKKDNSTFFGLGFAAHSNNKKGDLQTENNTFRFMTPWLNLNYQYNRIWIDEIETEKSFGVLNAKDVFSGGNAPGEDKSLDSYAMFGDEGDIAKNYDEHGEPLFDGSYNHYRMSDMFSGELPEKFIGGSLPDYDVYNVVAQGVGGTMQPFLRDNPSLFRKNTEDIEYKIHKYNSLEKADFRFLGDFSNSFKINDEWGFNVNNVSFNPTAGYSVENINQDGYNPTTKRLAGSKHVEYFTNWEISAAGTPASNTVWSTPGFIDYPKMYGDDNDKSARLQTNGSYVSDQVGGYSITNSSGMTYHFALPVYTYDHHQYYEKEEQGEPYTRETEQKQAYAYTWLLTAVTGPDFVDVNGNGYADESDFGYWVTMEYGKWADNYQFRNPEVGFNIDVDGSKTYTYGKKELYYLDKIKTRTHQALFVKKIRPDGKGVSNKDNGGFNNDGNSVSTLKLVKIILIENDELESIISTNIESNSTNYQHSLLSNPNERVHYGENVIDIHDLASIQSQIDAKSIKTIELLTDYSLVPETPNSFYSSLDSDLGENDKNGKLTLNGIKTYGKGKADLIPGTYFDYQQNSEETQQIQLFNVFDEEYQRAKLHGSKFEIGDIVHFDLNGETYYGVVTEYYPDFNWVTFKYIGDKQPTNHYDTYVQSYITENPPYNKEYYDIWGMYKSDYDKNSNGLSYDRLVTDLSSKNVNAWSLRKVKTSIGAEMEIKYESDEYSESTMQDGFNYMVKSFAGMQDASLGTNEVRIDLHNTSDYFSSLVPNVSEINLLAYFKERIYNCDIKEADLNHCNFGCPNGANLDDDTNDIFFENSLVFKRLHTSNSNDILGIVVENAELREIVDKIDFTYIIPPPMIPVAANIKIANKNLKGGGIRVNNIAVYNPTNGKRIVTNYAYDTPTGSSGVTPYEPNALSSYKLIEQYEPIDIKCKKGTMEAIVPQITRAKYMGRLYKNYNNAILLAKNMVAPGVIYGNVKVTSGTRDADNSYYANPSSKVYEFQTFNNNMIEREVLRKSGPGPIYWNQLNKVSTRGGRVTIHNRTASLGGLLSVTTLDKNDIPVNKSVNHYSNDPSPYNNQGRHDELYHEHRKIMNETVNSGFLKEISVITHKKNYPTILTGREHIDYQTGVKKSLENKSFDFFSGMVTEYLTSDSYGNKILTKTTPAYQLEEGNGEKKYQEMGLKIFDPFNKNMLVQNAVSESFKGEVADVNKIMGINIQTWSDDWEYEGLQRVFEIDAVEQVPIIQYKFTLNGKWPISLEAGADVLFQKRDQNGKVLNSEYLKVTTVNTLNNSQTIFTVNSENGSDFTHVVAIPSPYRKHQSFVWDSPNLKEDGSFDGFVPFNWDNIETQNPLWTKVSETTKYNPYSKGLEATDVNGNYKASHVDEKSTFVLASAVNANYYEFAHSGAEKTFANGNIIEEGNVAIKGNVDNTVSHSGNNSVKITNGDAFEMNIVKENISITPRYFKAMVWYKGADNDLSKAYLTINANGQTETVSGNLSDPIAEGWRLLTVKMQITGDTDVSIKCGSNNGEIYFDDFRVQPINATITAFVYNDWNELSYIIGNDNKYTKYEYDGEGRLRAIYQESFKYGVKKISEQSYNFGSDNQ